MAEPRFFTTLPCRVIADTDLTALDMRCMAVIALHDGMSGVSGKGGGCYARNQTLAALARTDVTNFSKSLTKLIRLGYINREPQLMDKRRFTLRVQYDKSDSWRTDQQSPPQDEGAANKIVGEAANPDPQMVGEADSENGSFSKGIETDYISLNEELHFDESSELHSHKGRTVPARGLAEWIDQLDALPNDGAKVAHIDRAWRDAPEWIEQDRKLFANYLWDVHETYQDENKAVAAQAIRLWEAIAPC